MAGDVKDWTFCCAKCGAPRGMERAPHVAIGPMGGVAEWCDSSAVVIHDGESSVVTDNGDGTVTKRYKDTYRHLGDYERELQYYQRFDPGQLRGHDVAARTLTLNHCGLRVTRETLPPDWRTHVAEWFAREPATAIQHNDIRPENILAQRSEQVVVVNGRHEFVVKYWLMLIDWQWWKIGRAHV